MKKLINLNKVYFMTILIVFSINLPTTVFGGDFYQDSTVLSTLNSTLNSKAQGAGFTIDKDFTHLLPFNWDEIAEKEMEKNGNYVIGGIGTAFVGTAVMAALYFTAPWIPITKWIFIGGASLATTGFGTAGFGMYKTLAFSPEEEEFVNVTQFNIQYKMDSDHQSLIGNCVALITSNLQYMEILKCTHSEIFTETEPSAIRINNEGDYDQHYVVASRDIY